MRGLILFSALILCFSSAGAFAAAKKNAFRGQIYSFDQLMRLTPAKRAQYISDLRQIVLKMEKQQKGFEIADATRLEEMKAQVATLMQMMAMMPLANAASDENMPGQAPPSSPAPAAPAAPAQEASTDPAPDSTAGSPAEGIVTPAATSVAAPAPAAAGGSCQPPQKLACKDMSKEERKKLVDQFRAEKPNECITAGNFVKYKNNTPRPGNCSYVYAFPSEKSEQKIHCDRGESLCNPLLFCVGVDVDISGTSQFLPAPICVPIGQEMTNTCLAKYQEATASKSGRNNLDFSDLKKKAAIEPKHKKLYMDAFNQARKAKPRQCDFSKDLKNFPGLKEKYDELKASIEERYKNLCVGNSPYQAMFCDECAVIGQQIYIANTKGGLGGCAGSQVAAAVAPAPGETPTAW